MARVFWDGFDKYGDPHKLTDGEWTQLVSVDLHGNSFLGQISFVAGQFGGATGGSALQVQTSLGGGSFTLTRTLPNNFATLIVGIRFQTNLALQSSFYPLVFGDGVTDQCGIGIDTSGRVFAARNYISSVDPHFGQNGFSPTILGTSTASVTKNVWHYLEAQIDFAASGASIVVNVDNIPFLSLNNQTTINTVQSGNNYANTYRIFGAFNNNFAVDDCKCFDTTGGTNNALVGDQRVETLFATADSVNASSIGQGVIGKYYSLYDVIQLHSGIGNPGLPPNPICVVRCVPAFSGNLQSISWVLGQDDAMLDSLPVVYSDNAGAPHSLLATGPAIVGSTKLATITAPLTAPLAITQGVPIWIGYQMNDATIAQVLADGGDNAIVATNSSFAPLNTFTPFVSSGSTGQIATPQMWGNVNGITGRFNVINLPLPGGDLSYVVEQAVNNEDRWVFESLSSNPNSIAGVKVSGYIKKDDGGNRTIDMEADSGGTIGFGDATGLSPAQSYAWISSYFTTDPATGSPWGGTGVDNATYGLKIIS